MQLSTRLLRQAIGSRTILQSNPEWICKTCSSTAASRLSKTTSTQVAIRQRDSRTFSLTARFLKKTKNHPRDTERSDVSPPTPVGTRSTATDDVYDFSNLEAGILKAIERLTHDLSELRAGGRFNPEILDPLKVVLSKGGGHAKLGDLAQIVSRGRNIQVIVGEEEHVGAISRAILSSPHSLNPQGPTAEAPTTLTLQIPPATGESRQAALEEARRLAQTANDAVIAERQKHNKHMRSLELSKKVRPDDVHKAKKQMEEVVKRGTEEVKRITDGAKRVLEGS